jgi:hypothetical protein
MRTIAESVLQIIMEADAEGLVGAARHERSGLSGFPCVGGRLNITPPWP